MATKTHINWVNTLFLIITPIVAVFGTITIAVLGTVYWKTVALALTFWILGGLSITAGYHRLFSHVAYQASWPVRLAFVLIGAANFEGSVLEWCTDHRDHHRFTDTPKDPYNFKQGFWYAHIGWLFTLDPEQRDYANVEDLQKDKLILFQHHYYIAIAIAMGFVLPMCLAGLWGDWIGGLIIAGALRITITQHMTFCVNSVCHAFGKHIYSDRNSARDNWFTALFTFGEGYHNFHHKFPLDYRNGIRFYDFDPTKWLIKILEFFRLAKNLKQVSLHRIVKNRLDMDKKRLVTMKNQINDNSKAIMDSLYQSINQMLVQIDNLESRLTELKNTKMDYMKDRKDEYHQLLKQYHKELKKSSVKLKYLMKTWTYFMKQSVLQPIASY